MALLSVRTYGSAIALAVVAFVVAGGTFGASLPSAAADVITLTGSASNYTSEVSLYGGPAETRGHGQPHEAPQAAASPYVACPAGGGFYGETKPEGARAQYGPVVLFGGIWPDDASSAPPSGPLSAHVDCGEGIVTAATSVTLTPEGTAYPGGAGPGPFVADEVHSSCTATATGLVVDVTLVEGLLEVGYDEETQLPTETELIPENPAPNTVREGTIDHVGDRYRITFNQQDVNPDGSLTVNAVHLELLGPTAVGELVIGQSTCGVTTSAPAPGGAPQEAAPQEAASQDRAPHERAPSPETPADSAPRSEGSAPTVASASPDSATTADSTRAGGPRVRAGTDRSEPPGTRRASQTNPFQIAQAQEGDATALAFNYTTDVGLFGGPSNLRGYGQPDDAPATAASPSAECSDGGADSETKAEGASAQYGPAVIFGGIWPEDAPSAPPSGPLTSEVECEEGSVTASTTVTLAPSGAGHPGGVGPGPFIADEVHSSCTMTAAGVTSDVEIVEGILETAYDEDTQLPTETEPIPQNPAPNTVREGTIDHVGDRYRITFNQQIENPDGSFTVNAAHMELLGPIAVGDMVVGSATCGLGATTASPGTNGETGTDETGTGGTGTGGTGTTDRSGAADGRTGPGTSNGQLARTGSDPLPATALGLSLLLAGTLALRSGRLGHAAEGPRR